MIPLLPALLIGGGSWFGWKTYQRKKELTPERKAVFEKAMNAEDATPTNLRALAAEFAKVGLSRESKLLNQRAALKEAPPEVKARRREVFTKAMASTEPDAILRVAASFEKIGATGAADTLKTQAEAVKAVKDL